MAKPQKTTRPKPPKPEAPNRAGDTLRDNKKSVGWRDDPEILQRLTIVAQCMNRNMRAFEIAIETKVSIETARNDIARVRELWKADATERIENAKDIAIAQYGAIINQAWADLKKVKSPQNPARAAYHNVILKAQRQMDSVSGIATKHELSGPNGGPVPVEVVDTEAIRNKRWSQVAPNLAEMNNKETNVKPESADQKP